MASYIIKKGYASVKEDVFRSFLWSKRWLVLREQTLTIQRNEVRGINKKIFKKIFIIIYIDICYYFCYFLFFDIN